MSFASMGPFSLAARLPMGRKSIGLPIALGQGNLRSDL
jgi:hypothetical protein